MEQRKEFIKEYLQGTDNFKLLCEHFEISEKTGHKWKNRFLEYGYAGLLDQSKTPANSPNQLDEDTVIRLIKMRTAHITWGPKKLAVLYEKAYPESLTPSESSIYRVLGKADLIQKRRIRHADTSASRLRKRIEANEPNDVWTVDFKGWWVSKGERCMPLTVRDLKSKCILDISLMESTTAIAVRAVFENLFHRYGLPKVIRSDNGTPFATTNGLLGMTTLSAWWMFLGIIPDRTDPGCPTQNGSHERMHADLSREIQGKIPGGIAANQRAIDAWVDEYNQIRPHEALGMKTPSEVYCKSSIPYNGTPDEIEYPIGFMTRKINKNGIIKINSMQYTISSSLRGLTVGLQPNSDDDYLLWLGDYPIGLLDTKLACLNPMIDLE
ncbi:MAG: integrase core domain-containing protein [Saccharofermentanales bacterium]